MMSDRFASRRNRGKPATLVVLSCLVLMAVAVPAVPNALAGAQPASVVGVAREERQEARPSGEQVLRLSGTEQPLPSLDPVRVRDLPTGAIVRHLFRGLTRLDKDLRPVPELAERIEISADGFDYTVALRSNAVFHDGRAITAADVVFSLTRALDPDTVGGDPALLGGPTFLSDIAGAAEVLGQQTDDLAGLEVIDERTLRIRLVAPSATFLMKLASVPASVVDEAEVAADPEWSREPNGSGPFRLESWRPDELMTLVPHDGFFAGRPTLDRVELILGPSAGQGINLYEADRSDIERVPPTAIDRVTDPASPLWAEVTRTPLLAVQYIAFRTDVAPMDDPHVRRAVQLAFPREKVAAVTYDGKVTAATGLIPSGMLGREWATRVEPYDLAEARHEIAASSYGAPEHVPPIRIFNGGDGSAEALRDTLAADLGLRVEVIAVEWSEFNDGLGQKRYPAYELYWGADYPDPESFLTTLFGPGRGDNYIDYRNEAMADLLRIAAAEDDEARRVELYAQAQQLLMDDHAVIPLFYDVEYVLAKPYVKGLELTALGLLRLESIWLERRS